MMLETDILVFFLCPGTRADTVCTGTADSVFDFGGLVLDKDGGKTSAEVSGSFFSRFFNFIRYSCISGGTLIAASAALLTSTTVLLFGARIPDTASRSKSSIVVETVEFEWIPALSSAL